MAASSTNSLRALIAAFVLVLLCAQGEAAVARSSNRLGVSAVTWQESMTLQAASGAAAETVANYRGFMATFERSIPRKWGRYSLLAGLGQVQASGGGTSTSVVYRQGNQSAIAILLHPGAFYYLTQRVALGLGVDVFYRSIEWPSSGSVQVGSSQPFGALVTFDIDAVLSRRLSFRQSFGVGSFTIGPFWRWGLAYQL